jgi:hypothetical protein
LCCISSAAAQPVTPEELVSELTAILTLLETARSEYETVSTELESTQAQLETLKTEEMPLLQRRLTDLRGSFDDYRQTVSMEIDRLTCGLYVTGGAALLAILAALIVMFGGVI